jgi:hypothetical protein
MASNIQTNQSNSTEKTVTTLAGQVVRGSSGQSPQEIIAKNATESSQIQRYQFISDNPKFYICIGVQKYARLNAMQIAKGNSIAQIILPLPQQLNDTQFVQYTPTELQQAGAIAANAGAPVFNAITGRDTSGLDPTAGGSNIGGNVMAMLGKAFAGAGAAATGALGEGFTAGLQAATGLTMNQFQVLLLKGPTYKKHEMTWKISPKNLRESFGLKNMVADVNNWMAPGILFDGLLFTFPAIFNIEFSHPQFLYRFKPAVMESCSVNYAGSGVPSFHKDGEPESLILKMSFWEMEFWLAGQHARADDTSYWGKDGVKTPNYTDADLRAKFGSR